MNRRALSEVGVWVGLVVVTAGCAVAGAMGAPPPGMVGPSELETGFTVNAAAGSLESCSARELQEVVADDAGTGNQFGFSVSIDGDVALVGAPWNGDNDRSSGSAYVLRFDGFFWNQEARLLPPEGPGGDREFGWSVSLSGDVALVSDRFDNRNGDHAGAAYVYRFDGARWNLEATLLASDGQSRDNFGESVSLDGGVALIGALRDDDNGESSGSAYVFRFDGDRWNEQAKLLPSDGEVDDFFGVAVALDGNVGVIGSVLDDDNNRDSGSAYVFRFDGANWNEEAKLLASDGTYGDRFGAGVSIHDGVALIGAGLNDDNGVDSGSAYVFRFDGRQWNEEAKLVPSDGQEDDRFGRPASLRGNVALVGAWGDDDQGENSGSVYVFTFDGANWNEEAKLRASEGREGDQFGGYFNRGVSLNRDGTGRAVIGAPRADRRAGNAGSAYFFAGLGDCNDNAVLDACDVASGTSPDCNTNRAPDECDIAAGTSRDVNENGVPDECEFCTGQERIAKSRCRARRPGGKLVIRLEGGVKGNAFRVNLSNGQRAIGHINGRGRARVTFDDQPVGRGTVTAKFSCGARDRKVYGCR